MQRWTGRWTLGGVPVRRTVGEMFCHLSTAQQKGVEAVAEECRTLGEVWVCDAHQRDLIWRALLRPECVEVQEGDRVFGRCTGENEQDRRCERPGTAYYPAMPRCASHEEQLPTRWDIEAEHDPPTIATPPEPKPAPAPSLPTWDDLRARGRRVVDDARARLAQQTALALD